jgi:5-(carboxyamino)imidazole ribonucleotide mutase
MTATSAPTTHPTPSSGPATAAGSADRTPTVAVVMGSDSDLGVMSGAVVALTELGVSTEVRVVSAHRSPLDMIEFGRTARDRGIGAIVAGAGGAAHLPGMLASVTSLPVIGVPVPLTYLDGMDSLLSIVQMPAGIPVATVAIGGAKNAGILAARILGIGDPALRARLEAYERSLAELAEQKGQVVRDAARVSPSE